MTGPVSDTRRSMGSFFRLHAELQVDIFDMLDFADRWMLCRELHALLIISDPVRPTMCWCSVCGGVHSTAVLSCHRILIWAQHQH